VPAREWTIRSSSASPRAAQRGLRDSAFRLPTAKPPTDAGTGATRGRHLGGRRRRDLADRVRRAVRRRGQVVRRPDGIDGAAEGAIEPAALVYLGYPFHAPGKPDKPRGAHLALIRPPQLFVEGDVDPFIQPIADFEASVATSADAEIVWIPGGGHSFEVKGQRRPPDEVGAALAPTVAEWLRTRV
jgi:hypothetical protein